ncbi:MAG: hypothetical protein WDZ76_06135 [Pseudohongiellaceae bacterium]
MRAFVHLRTTLVILTCCLVAPATAYEFRYLLQRDAVHTWMAAQALRCAAAAETWKDIVDCEDQNLESAPAVLYAAAPAGNTLTLTVSDVEKAVIWPDDPVRELRWYKLYRIGLWSWRLAVDNCGRRIEGIHKGLRCSSHYGPMQFLHAMESERELAAADTKEAILDWIQYAYSVAGNDSGDSGFNNDLPYCATINQVYGRDSKFAKAMMPYGDTGFPCVKDGPPWRMSTPFSFSCIIRSSSCWETITPNDEGIRLAALGAVLHVIQDSYAKGHTSRGNDTADSVALFECNPIKQFQLYGEQDHDVHRSADKFPKRMVGCGDEAVDGPVTASAKILKLYAAGAPWSDVDIYLRQRVFLLDAQKNHPAGTTELMRRRN